MIVPLVLVLVVAGIVLPLRTEPFTPHPSLARARRFVVGLAAGAGVPLVASLGLVWWMVDDAERAETLTTRGTSPLPATIVAFGLAGAALTVLAARGRRNWAPALLAPAWLLAGYVWAFEATGEAVDSDAAGSVRSGLTLATWALLAVTLAAAVGSFLRVAEHHARRPEARPDA